MAKYVDLFVLSAARNDEGMNRTGEGHMRSPFKQDNISSSSLEGMERPIPSFKSFIRTVPPYPTAAQKPLPPTPSPRKERPSLKKNTSSTPASTPSPASAASAGRNFSVASWKAPAEWYNNSTDAKEPLPSPPIPATRTYSPLLPEPSPDTSGLSMDPISWLGSPPPQSSRLLPIYERQNGNTDLGPPRSPPRSPLPVPPAPNSRVDNKVPSPEQRSMNNSPAMGNRAISDLDLRYSTASPANSGKTSITSNASTNQKAFAALGIGSPTQQTVILENRTYSPDSISHMERTRADRQYLRGKKLRALNKGSPLADDSWEDTEMDDKTRQLSFSQDYHDLLADQYQEMNVRAEEVLRSGGPHQVYDAHFDEPKPKPPLKDHDLVPRPLSWQKESGRSTPSSPSQDRSTERSSTSPTKGKHRRITSWVPHRLSVAPRRQSVKRHSSELSRDDSSPPREKQIPEAEVDRVLKEGLRFSLFFPPSRAMKFGRKHNKNKSADAATKAPPFAASPPQSASPLMRLPGGLAVVWHSPSLAPKSEAASVQELSPTSDQAPSGSQQPSDHSIPASNPSDNRSSFNSRHSLSPVAPAVAVHNKFRASVSSSFSHRSSTSSHPLAQEVSRSTRTPPPLPPAPPIPPSLAYSPPLSPDAWKRLKSHNQEEVHHRPSFIEKAKEARRRHNREARQERLKRSIRVLGPTDPGVVAGYVRKNGTASEDSDVRGRLVAYVALL